MASPSPDHIPFALPDIGEAEIEAVVSALRSGWLTTGPNAAAFESEFSAQLASIGGGEVTSIAVNSATAGLHLALEACGIGPGDEVIIPDWTFTATGEVVRYLGADVVVVDVDPKTLNVDLAVAERAITARTKAIVPVHFAGLPVDRTALADLASAHGLRVVEDAAHAHPVVSGGLPVGTGTSDAVVFSFYATKTMTTGEGGMVTVHDPDLARRIRTMRLHGISRDVFDRYRSTVPSWHYEVVAPGFKYNLPDPAAAMGRVQLSRAATMLSARRSIATRYAAAFADLPVTLPAGLDLPDDQHAWHLFVLRLNDDAPLERDAFIQRMADLGVSCSVHFIPLHLQPYWRDTYRLDPADFPVAHDSFARAVSLPAFSSMTDEQVQRVIDAVREVLG
ncbi:aminotransferase class I/II-fold pyridoxal phosphate-dependent enzyme [Nocardioides sp. MAH-18]|uniref:Aminotransferase class I/II-fold pyridoxal phosphate-dependent enzyme n=1 Tax=Nocardioides agri TaxID=2682843 RepID=A0A6L6XSX8_9ACTN|nr:DegT/DnrJ/EryC1/StrS family aminotransferase [Nocardioides sp. CGMCC 1.13656]MBA2954883.1 DegT/DnrJ/EryC1/StrS family aminotransferase [Nocardioides sp. CGMCC 1.13656]MVQ49737.1 aminotransferase class I/II-fold pyridoxal phosphate-dependent enzyme [Nocardioides sp. MAH-18]